MTEQEKDLEGKLKVPYFEISGKTAFNVVGKLIGGYILYESGKFIGGDFGAIVGAYTGLRCNYYQCKNALAEITFERK